MAGHYKTYRDTGSKRVNRVISDHAQALILTLNLTLTLSLNPKALTLNPLPKPYHSGVTLYVLQ